MVRFLCVLTLSMTAWAADPPKFTTPEADFPADDLRAAGPDDKAYPLPQDAAKAKELNEAKRKWISEQIFQGFDASGKGGAEGKKALEAVVDYITTSRGTRWTLSWADTRDEAIKAAVKAGCNAPAVTFFNTIYAAPAEIAIENAENLVDIRKELAEKKCSDFLQAAAAREHASWLVKAGEAKSGFRKDARKAVEDCLKFTASMGKSDDPTAQRTAYNMIRGVLGLYVTAGWGLDKGWEAIENALNEANINTCLHRALEGSYYLDVAIGALGSSKLDDLNEDREGKVKDAIKSMETALKAAAAADDKSPLPPTLMIAYCRMTAKKRSVMEGWFTKAMEADPDNFDAVREKLAYLDPRNQGSPEELFRFGRQCLRTKNWAGGLPIMLVDAHRRVAGGRLSDHCKRHDSAWADVREVYELAIQWKPQDRQLRCEYALICEAVGHPKAAQEHLKSINGKYYEGVFPKKTDFDNAMKRIDKAVKENEKK